MMSGWFNVDGYDAYAQYSVFVVWEGYKGIISRPSFKAIEFNDWQELDGIEPDLSSPVLDAREFAITFGSVDAVRSSDFLDRISDGGYHDFVFWEIGYRARLRLVSQPDKEVFFRLEKSSLRFSDDFPELCYQHGLSPKKGLNGQVGYELDNHPFSDYGVYILDGSDEEIEKSPAVKKNLLVGNGANNGVFYDGERVVFQQKDVSLKCGLVVEDMHTFWMEYDALFESLISTGERQFYTDRLGESYPCYYKGCECTLFDIIDGRVWCEFTLTLVFISFRVGESVYLLATEDDVAIETEDGDNLIDVKDYGIKAR